MAIEKREIQNVIDKYRLTSDGLPRGDEKDKPLVVDDALVSQVEWCLQFYATLDAKTLRRWYSYTLKHAVEQFTKDQGSPAYIRNVAAIIAAAKRGFTIRPAPQTHYFMSSERLPVPIPTCNVWVYLPRQLQPTLAKEAA